MTSTLENISKNLLLLALALLLFRNGSFSGSFTLKPYELLFTVVLLLTAIDVLKNKKIKEFFSSAPKSIYVALGSLLFFVLLGWGIATVFFHIPTPLNMVLEFGNFIICILTFLLILFYSKGDDSYAKKCLYTLLVPLVYGVFILVPSVANHVYFAQDGTFNGLTDNVNLMAKILLVPALYCGTMAMFVWGNKKILFAALATIATTLVFWTAERGAILSLAVGLALSYAIFAITNKQWKKILLNTLVGLLIICFGFILLPYSGKKIFLDRILHRDACQAGSIALQDKTLNTIVSESSKCAAAVSEPRSVIWSFYLKQIPQHPLGIGPNTHVEAHIMYNKILFVDPGPHNTYIELLLWGGIGALISFLYLVWAAYKNMYAIGLSHNVFLVAVAGTLTSLLVSVFFNDSIILIWLWVILALAIRPSGKASGRISF